MSFCPILMKLWLIEEQKSRLEKYIIFLVTMQLLSAKTPISTFPNMTFQLHPIITPLILDQLACSLPKTNTTFHQLFKYVTKDANFSSIRWENSRNIFGPCSLRSTVLFLYPNQNKVAPLCHWSSNRYVKNSLRVYFLHKIDFAYYNCHILCSFNSLYNIFKHY